MRLAIVRQATRVTDEQCEKIADAIQIQLATQCSPVWGWLPDTVQFFADATLVPPDWDVFTIKDNIDDPNALGFHSETSDGCYFAEIAVSPVLDNGGGVLDGGTSGYSVASVVSHEAVELRADATVNLWADGPSISEGSSYALEPGDPVEGDSYEIMLSDGTKVLVSNWVGPRFFDQNAKDGFFDWCGKATAPFQKIANGYFVVRSAPGTEQEVFGASMPPDWRLAMKAKGRTARRKRAA